MDRYDLVIRNATVIDGTRAPRYQADIGVLGGKIAAIGRLDAVAAHVEIDAANKVASPGFIDSHTHDDRLMLSAPDMAPKVSQGVTTVVAGNCGCSLAPAPNGMRAPVTPPLDLLDEGGGWFRFPSFADYVAELEANPAATNCALLVGHTMLRLQTMDHVERAATKNEIVRMRELADEALAAGAVGVPVWMSHHKVAGQPNHGRSTETLQLIEARMKSQPIGLDCYPYCASSTILSASRAAVASKTLVTWSKPHPEVAGMSLDEIRSEMKLSIEQLLPAGAIYFSMDEADVQRILAFEHTMIGSDGLPHDAAPHPRLWGTFPRVLGHYARGLGLFPLETAVHKMTGLTARTFGLKDRGVLKSGMAADIAIFDAGEIDEAATFAKPIQPAKGIDTVIVNGAIVWREEKRTAARRARFWGRASPGRATAGRGTCTCRRPCRQPPRTGRARRTAGR